MIGKILSSHNKENISFYNRLVITARRKGRIEGHLFRLIYFVVGQFMKREDLLEVGKVTKFRN